MNNLSIKEQFLKKELKLAEHYCDKKGYTIDWRIARHYIKAGWLARARRQWRIDHGRKRD